MARKAPGKHYRKGLSLTQVCKMFPDDDKARQWFEKTRWPNGPYCPHCGSFNVQSQVKHPRMTHRCRDCPKKPFFSLKTGTVMQSSNLGYQVWAIATYLMTTHLKGVSSLKLHRDLDVTQKTAWHLAHRLRKSFETKHGLFSGPIEFDETYFGGKEKNKHTAKKRKAGRGTVGKAIVVGAKDRNTNQISAKVTPSIDQKTLHGFVKDHAAKNATVYTDDLKSYRNLPYPHEVVCHSAKEYVNGQAHTNGIESFWALLKRGYHGTYHYMSEKHLNRYVNEFSGRHNAREFDTLDQMARIANGMNRKQLTYRELIA